MNPTAERVESRLIDGEVYTRESIIEKWSPMIHKVCIERRQQAKTKGLEHDDLYQIGCIGLLRAFETYDNSQASFKTHAYWGVWGYIKRALTYENVGLYYPGHIKEMAASVIKNDLREETPEAVSEKLKVSVENAAYVLNCANKNYGLSLNSSVAEDSDLGDTLGREGDFTSVIVKDFLGTLSERERVLVIRRLAGDTQQEIGNIVGLSRKATWYWLERIKGKLHDYMEVGVQDEEILL